MLDERLNLLGIPNASRVDRVVFKKLFYESGALDAADKKALKDDVSKIRWLYSLKPETCPIAPYITDERDYGEVAIISVELTEPKRVRRVAQLMHKAIPYPLLVWFCYDNELALSVADKRNSQADKDKWVLEDHWLSPWLGADLSPEVEAAFWDDSRLNVLPSSHYEAFYKGWKVRVLALLCAEHTRHYQREGKDPDQRIETLKTLERQEQQRAELKNQLKKEKQMGRQVALNTQLRELDGQIAHTVSQL